MLKPTQNRRFQSARLTGIMIPQVLKSTGDRFPHPDALKEPFEFGLHLRRSPRVFLGASFELQQVSALSIR